MPALHLQGRAYRIRQKGNDHGRPLALVQRGERIVIARAGKPVAELRPVRRMKKRAMLLDDPLLRVDEYSYDGPIGVTTNRDFDSTVCGG